MMTGDWGIAYGKQNVFYEMLRGFSEHWDQVSVICPSNEKGEVIKIHGNVYLYPSGMSKTLHLDFLRHKGFSMKKAREIHKENPVDIMAAHVIPPLMANVKAAMQLSRELGVPYVAEVMHIPGHPEANNLMERVEKWTLARFIKKHGREIPHMRLINRFDTYDYVTGLGFPKEKILYIPAFYLDFELFKDVGKEHDPKKLVFCGRLEKNKGLDLLVEAMKKVKKEEPDVKLSVVGDGGEKKWLSSQLATCNLQQNVEIVGWLPTRDDVAKIYQESGALVMTSYNEGGPRVTLEAMACGALCISTRVGIMQEVVRDRENALFIDWNADDIAEKILWAVRNPDEAVKVAEEGRKSVQKFEYGKALEYYAKKYDEIS